MAHLSKKAKILLVDQLIVQINQIIDSIHQEFDIYDREVEPFDQSLCNAVKALENYRITLSNSPD